MARSRIPQQISGITIGLPVLITLIAMAVALGTGYGVLSAYVIRNTVDVRDLRVAFGEITNIRIDQVLAKGEQKIMQQQLASIERLLENHAAAYPVEPVDPLGKRGG